MKTYIRKLGFVLLMGLSFSSFALTEKPICPTPAEILAKLGEENLMLWKNYTLDNKYLGEFEFTDDFNTGYQWIFVGEVMPHYRIITSVDEAWDLFRTHMSSLSNERREAKLFLNDPAKGWWCVFGPAPYYDDRDDVDGILYEAYATDKPSRNPPIGNSKNPPRR
jgi:hypothetical protein